MPRSLWEAIMEFSVEFEVRVPAGAPEDEVEDRENAEPSSAAKLAKEGHLVRPWKLSAARGQTKAVGLYPPAAQASPTACSALCRSLTGYT
jgi:muconolactone delta-isomerase